MAGQFSAGLDPLLSIAEESQAGRVQARPLANLVRAPHKRGRVLRIGFKRQELPDGHPSDSRESAVLCPASPNSSLQANDILRSFVFPDSRAQFLRLLKRAGLLDGSDAGLQEVFSVAEADFWSYATEESLGGIEDG